MKSGNTGVKPYLAKTYNPTLRYVNWEKCLSGIELILPFSSEGFTLVDQ